MILTSPPPLPLRATVREPRGMLTSCSVKLPRRGGCVGGVCWRPAIGLPAQSVVVGEVGRCLGVRWRAGRGLGVLRTGPVAAGVRVYSSVGHL
jgi:hypothetical protein